MRRCLTAFVIKEMQIKQQNSILTQMDKLMAWRICWKIDILVGTVNLCSFFGGQSGNIYQNWKHNALCISRYLFALCLIPHPSTLLRLTGADRSHTCSPKGPCNVTTGGFCVSSIQLFLETSESTYQSDCKLERGKYLLGLFDIGFALKLNSETWNKIR